MTAPRMNSEIEIQALEDVCQRLAGFDETISLEWLDGYMTALLAGPRRPDLLQWLQAICDGAFERAYADPDAAAEALWAIEARWNVLADHLDPASLLEEPDALRLAPLMLELSDEDKQRLIDEGHVAADEIELLEQTGEVWALGFLDATRDYPEDWPEADLETEDGRYYDQGLLRIVALTLHDEDELKELVEELFPGEELTRDDLIHEACYAAQDLRLYWVDHAPRPQPRRVDPLPGRNDYCPCGSGKKYKKCHGALVH